MYELSVSSQFRLFFSFAVRGPHSIGRLNKKLHNFFAKTYQITAGLKTKHTHFTCIVHAHSCIRWTASTFLQTNINFLEQNVKHEVCCFRFTLFLWLSPGLCDLWDINVLYLTYIHTEVDYNSERFEPRWVNVVVWVIIRVCSVVLRRTVVSVDWHFDNMSGSHYHSDVGFRSGCRNVSQHQQQSFSGLHYKPGRSLKPQRWSQLLTRALMWAWTGKLCLHKFASTPRLGIVSSHSAFWLITRTHSC